MNYLLKFSAWLKRNSTYVIWGLLICVIMQQCTISALQKEISFLQDKYTTTSPSRLSDEEIANKAGEVEQSSSDSQSVKEIDVEPTHESKNSSSIVSIIISTTLLILFAYLLLWMQGLLPFCVSIKGKLWQDLTGKIVFTLSIANRTRKSQNVSNATICFIGKNNRRFRMPVADFPLDMQPHTKHVVNVSLQRLLEQNQDLLDYKALRAEVECNGKICKTFPLVVKWKRQ
ncbi:MAG: hypothetical protein K6G73_07600 [Marinilabiliaceae bacterium]|nr:hypothetical protein [Marinilabiliaceae bacterium]